MSVESIDSKYAAATPPPATKEAGNVTIVALASELENDEGLHELGYKAELHRTRGFTDVFAMSLTCESAIHHI